MVRYTKGQITKMTNEELLETIMYFCCKGNGKILDTKHKQQVCRWILTEMDRRGFALNMQKFNDLI